MSLFERFAQTKEEGFRDNFIQPLLIRLGYIGVTNKHGRAEFGKDFVFSDLDRFGNLKHMIVQAKHEKTINQGNKVDELLSQIRQAFHVPFTVPNTPTEERFVSTVYVFNSGNITDGAQEQIRHSLPREHRTNTHFYNGDQLETLARAGAMRHDESIRSMLIGLNNQLLLNVQIWSTHLTNLDQAQADSRTWDIRGACLHAIEAFLSNPRLVDRISLTQVELLWQQAKIITNIVSRYYLSPFKFGEAIEQSDLGVLRRACNEAMARAVSLSAQITAALADLPEPTI